MSRRVMYLASFVLVLGLAGTLILSAGGSWMRAPGGRLTTPVAMGTMAYSQVTVSGRPDITVVQFNLTESTITLTAVTTVT